MSKYKVGDKFIVEVSEVLKSDKGTLYRSNFSTLVFDDYGLDALQKYDEVFKEKYKTNQKECERDVIVANRAYNEGLQDAWELLRKYIKMPHVMPVNAFIMQLTVQEALARMETREKEQDEIKVGDEVISISGGRKAVVTHINISGRLYVVWDDGSCGLNKKEDVKKTGKHIDIQGLLSQIGE